MSLNQSKAVMPPLMKRKIAGPPFGILGSDRSQSVPKSNWDHNLTIANRLIEKLAA